MRTGAPGLAIAPVTIGLYDRRGHFVATARYGSDNGHPLHAAACAAVGCHAVIYDARSFDEAVTWLRCHLSGHGFETSGLMIDLGPQRRRPAEWWIDADEAVRIAERGFCISPTRKRRVA
jgi:hypothetical protein